MEPTSDAETFSTSLGWGQATSTIVVVVLLVATAAGGGAMVMDGFSGRAGAAVGAAGIVLVVTAVVTLVISWALAPRGYRVSPEGLEILRNVGAVRVARERLVSADRVELTPGQLLKGLRLFGAGGVFGTFGWFWQANLGVFRAYVTRSDRLVRVGLLNGRPIVLSPDDPDGFVAALRQMK